MVELIIVISLISGVLGLLYLYRSRGLKLYNKSFKSSVLQADARSQLEQIMFNIKQASADRIFVGEGFNSAVPLPDKAFYDKPFLYFVKPSSIQKKGQVRGYDYYLYYIGPVRNKFDEFKNDDSGQFYEYYRKKAKMKLLIIRNQSKSYTEDSSKIWPFLPPIMDLGINQLPEDLKDDEDDENDNSAKSRAKKAKKKRITKNKNTDFDLKFAKLNSELNKSETSFLQYMALRDVSPEFSIHQSQFYFDIQARKRPLFRIRIHMVDEATRTKVDFESSVAPRN